MKTKFVSIILLCGLGLSSCSPGIATETHLPQSPQQPMITATSPSEGILTETTDPSPTSAPVTAESSKPDAEFSMSTSNQVPPDDILEEITYFGQGGVLCTEGPYAEPVVVFYPEDQELMIQSSMTVCGWQADELLTASVQYPDGRIETWSITAEKDDTGFYSARLDFQPLINDPTGTYIYTLEGSTGIVVGEARYQMPDGARLFSTPNNQQLFLYGFAPGEAVTVYCYGTTGIGKLLAWQEYMLDENGQLQIQAPIDQCNFAAIGALSGEVHLLIYDLIAGQAYDWAEFGIQKLNCGGFPSRLKGGMAARVAFTDGSNMRLRRQPGFSADIQTSLPEGTALILYEYECVDSSVWWHVATVTADGEQEGWMVEEQDGVYLLEPIQ